MWRHINEFKRTERKSLVRGEQTSTAPRLPLPGQLGLHAGGELKPVSDSCRELTKLERFRLVHVERAPIPIADVDVRGTRGDADAEYGLDHWFRYAYRRVLEVADPKIAEHRFSHVTQTRLANRPPDVEHSGASA